LIESLRLKADYISCAERLMQSEIPRLYDQAIIKQTSSNHRANIQQMHSKYTCTTCALIVRCLLGVCLMIAWSCKPGKS